MSKIICSLTLIFTIVCGCRHQNEVGETSSGIESTSHYKLYVDMDGVLTDFIGEYRTGSSSDFETDPENWNKINRWGEDFWLNMAWMQEGKGLWSHISKYRPVVLTSCGREPSVGCESGKRKWVKKNLGANVFVIIRYDKEKYADAKSILIDDMLKYLTPWREHKGLGIQHRRLDETLSELKKLTGN